MSSASRSGTPTAVRWGVGIVVVVVAINLLLAALRSALGGPQGPASSSYATSPNGVAAYAELLERHSHPIERLRGALADLELDPRGTIVLLDPRNLPPDDIDALRDHLDAGGRLVIGGGNPSWALRLMGRPPEWSPDGPTAAESLAILPETAGVERVQTNGNGAWVETGGAVPALGTSTESVVAVGLEGAGRLVMLADASPLHNELLGRADNAAFGLALAGQPGRPVYFAEGVHGYGTESGIGAIPTRWKWMLAGLTLAALVWMVATGWRLGPPEDEARVLAPSRRAYVDALANTLARTKRRDEAVEAVRATARETLARRAGLPPEADAASVRAAATRFGLNDDEARVLLGPVTGADDAIVVGRALARLGGGNE